MLQTRESHVGVPGETCLGNGCLWAANGLFRSDVKLDILAGASARFWLDNPSATRDEYLTFFNATRTAIDEATKNRSYLDTMLGSHAELWKTIINQTLDKLPDIAELRGLTAKAVASALSAILKTAMDTADSTIDPVEQVANQITRYDLYTAYTQSREGAWRYLEGTGSENPEIALAISTAFFESVHANIGDSAETILANNPAFGQYQQIQTLVALAKSQNTTEEQRAEALRDLAQQLNDMQAQVLPLLKGMLDNQQNLLDAYKKQQNMSDSDKQHQQQMLDQLAELQYKLGALRSGLFILSTIVSQYDEKLAREIAIYGQMAADCVGAVLDFLIAAETHPGLAAYAIVNLVSALMEVAIRATSPELKTPDEIIMQQLDALAEQVKTLGDYMAARFDRVDAALAQTYSLLARSATVLIVQGQNTEAEVAAARKALSDQRELLTGMKSDLQAWYAADAREEFKTAAVTYLRYWNRHGEDIGPARYQDAENAFYVYAMLAPNQPVLSGNPEWASLRPSTGRPTPIDELPYPYPVLLNYLTRIPATELGLAGWPVPTGMLPNPVDWLAASNAYLQLSREWPQYTTAVTSNDLDNLIDQGKSLESALATLSSTVLFDKLIENYKRKLIDLEAAIRREESVYASTTPLAGLGVDLWGGAQQTPEGFKTAIPMLLHQGLVHVDGKGYAGKSCNAVVKNTAGECVNLGSISRDLDQPPTGARAYIGGAPCGSLPTQFEYDPVSLSLRGVQGDGRNLIWQHDPRDCLDVQWADTTNGTPVWSYECNGTPAQVWTPSAGPDGAPGVVSGLDSAKCLNQGSSGLELRDCNYSTSQQLIISSDEPTRFFVTDDLLGKFIDRAIDLARPLLLQAYMSRANLGFCFSSRYSWAWKDYCTEECKTCNVHPNSKCEVFAGHECQIRLKSGNQVGYHETTSRSVDMDWYFNNMPANPGVRAWWPDAPDCFDFGTQIDRSFDPQLVDTARADLESYLTLEQTRLYAHIADAFQASAGPVPDAARELDNAKQLLKAYAFFGLYESVQRDLLRQMLGEAQPGLAAIELPDSHSIRLMYQVAQTVLPASNVRDQILPTSPALADLLGNLSTAIHACLNEGRPEGKALVDDTLSDLRAMRTLQSVIATNATPGSQVVDQVHGVSLQFTEVASGGRTSITVAPASVAGAVPSRYAISTGAVYDIATTAIYSGPVLVCFNVGDAVTEDAFVNLRVLHTENGTGVDRTVLPPDQPAPDFASRTLCARTSTLSPFAISHLTNKPPTAVCSSAVVAVDDACIGRAGPADVDGGSFDPDGDAVQRSVTPSALPLGASSVVLTVRDTFTASRTCTATVTAVDRSGPVFGPVPADAIAECDSVPAAAPLDARDNCDGAMPVTMTETRENATCPQSYRLDRRWTTADHAGNTSEVRQQVQVRDRHAPSVTVVPGPIACLWPPNHRTVVLHHVTAGLGIADRCDAAPVLQFRCVDETGAESADCVYSRPLDQLTSVIERAGNEAQGRIYRLLVTGVDACGNASAPQTQIEVHVPHDRRGYNDCLKLPGAVSL